MALLLSVLLLCSLSVGALAADEVGITAVLDNAKLTKSDTTQTVTLTIAPQSPVTACVVGMQVIVPEGWSIVSVTNDDANMPVAAGDVNLSNGTLVWGTSDMSDVSIAKFAIYTIIVPAGAEAGSYELKVTGVDVTKNYSTEWVMTTATTATATLTIEDGSVTPPEPVVPEGYSVSAVGDASINVGGEATVALNVTHKDSNAYYNAYYFEVTYDSTVLTYKGVSEGATVDSTTEGVLKIAGYGADKNSGTAAATLTFTGKAAGAGKVTITKANVDAKDNANAHDAPEATITTATATITVGGYSVTLPEGFSGAAGAAEGMDYTFKANGADYGCYDVTATMGGEPTTVTNNDGSFTIQNVTGAIVVKATPKIYTVTVTGTGAGAVSENAAKATYKTDYTFKLTKAEGCSYTVTVTAGGDPVTATATTEGVYTIPGTVIKGNLIITVEKTDIVIPTTTTITITGDTDDVKGGLTLTAKNGVDTTFKIDKKGGYTYTVTAGDTGLTVGKDGAVTIPGSLLKGAPLTVTVTKTAVNPHSVEVYEYVKLNGQSIWLVVAKSDSVLAYGTDTMFISEQYGGYCWLVISAENKDTVKTEAIAAVKAGSGTAAAVVYTGDVNGTGNTDVNDAQLVYNIYNTEYDSFDALSRAKFLAADMNGDYIVAVDDAVAVVNKVLGK